MVIVAYKYFTTTHTVCVCDILSIHAKTRPHHKNQIENYRGQKKPIWRGTIKRDQDEIIFTILWLLLACFQLIPGVQAA